jgi:subtilisin family serine protease
MTRRIPLVAALAVFLASILAPAAGAQSAEPKQAEPSSKETERYIVVLKDSVRQPAEVAERQAREHDAKIKYVYRDTFKGYVATLQRGELQALKNDPDVVAVAPDMRGKATAQHISTSIERAFALTNSLIDIDGVDDRVDVDVAVLDSGIDFDHADGDLNVFKNVNCYQVSCAVSTGSGDRIGHDAFGHGTSVAGVVAAKDNAAGVVGVAPGARLWNVRVANMNVRSPIPGPAYPFYMSDVIAGVQWVTDNASSIEVANMSMRFGLPQNPAEEALTNTLNQKITASVDAGVVYVVAAANEDGNVSDSIPANHPDVITVSGIADFDGLPGGLATPGGTPELPPCGTPGGTELTDIDDVDDTRAEFSNYGSGVEVAASAVCVDSTRLAAAGGGYVAGSGTSLATPQVAGAAALIASRSNPSSRADVLRIRDRLSKKGSYDWVDDSGDGVKEPLLDLTCTSTFAPKMVGGSSPAGNPDAESDVNCDGFSDLVTMRPDGVVQVFPGSSGSTFGSAVQSFQGGAALNSAQYDGTGHHLVDVADVDGDRRADLVTLNSNGSAYVHRGRTDKTFATGVASLSGVTPAVLAPGGHEPIAAADVNGDGRADLVTYNDQTYNVTVYRGKTDGTFETGTTALTAAYSAFHSDSTGVGRYFADVADVTGDGLADLVSMNTWKDLYVYAGQANGTFGAAVSSQWGNIDPAMGDGKGYEPTGVDDVNGDGRADLVLHKDGTSYVYPALTGSDTGRFGTPVSNFSGGKPSTTFGQGSGFGGGGTGDEMLLMNVDGDAYADLVLANTANSVSVQRGRASSSFYDPHVAVASGFTTTQHFRNGASTNNEVATEKPAWRRRGCPIVGCNTDGDNVGVWRMQTSTWIMRHWSTFDPNYLFVSYGSGFGAEQDMPVAGDWDGDGDDTVGVWRQGVTEAQFRLRNSNSAGAPDLTFTYGDVATMYYDDWPVVGDWDGDGDDTVGVWRSASGGALSSFLLRNSNSAGSADYSIPWGKHSTDLAVVGDWDGDGDDTVGIWEKSTNTFWLRSSNAPTGWTYQTVQFGHSEAPYNDIPVAGDWDGDGDDTVGVYRRQWGLFILRNSNAAGAADEYQVQWGAPAAPTYDWPVVGNWAVGAS